MGSHTGPVYIFREYTHLLKNNIEHLVCFHACTLLCPWLQLYLIRCLWQVYDNCGLDRSWQCSETWKYTSSEIHDESSSGDCITADHFIQFAHVFHHGGRSVMYSFSLLQIVQFQNMWQFFSDYTTCTIFYSFVYRKNTSNDRKSSITMSACILLRETKREEGSKFEELDIVWSRLCRIRHRSSDLPW